MNTVRILFCTDSLVAGGTEQQLVELLTHLDRQRFEPFVLCLYAERAGRSLHFHASLQALNIPVFILNLGWGVYDKFAGVLQVIRLVWQLRLHIVQAVNYHSNLLVRLGRPFLPFSLILIGCVFVEYTPKQIFYERISAWLCQVLVCNSPHIQKQLPSYCRVIHIPNGIDLGRFSFQPNSLFRQKYAPQANCVLLMLGRISRQKAPQLLLEALGVLKVRRQLPSDVQLWIVGECEDRDAQLQIDRIVEHNNLQSVVFQFPATTSPESFYSAADVTIITSLWEGLPGVMLESLASARPVIISESANRSGVIQHGVNGWVFSSGDVESLVQVLLGFFALSSSELQSIGSECRVYALPFTTELMVERYQELYKSLVSES